MNREVKFCGAKARSNSHQPCQKMAMANGRCHLHGGKCTGAKTPEGKLRQKMASWKDGFYSKEAILEREYLRTKINEIENFLRE